MASQKRTTAQRRAAAVARARPLVDDLVDDEVISAHPPEEASRSGEPLYNDLVRTLRQGVTTHSYSVREVSNAVLQFAAHTVISGAAGESAAQMRYHARMCTHVFSAYALQAVTQLTPEAPTDGTLPQP